MSESSFPLRLMMGPGPSEVPPEVLDALSRPVIGHLDPAYLALMDRVAEKMRTVFRTKNEATFALPATAGAAMEACLVNLLEPGDKAVVGVNGYFGERMVDIAERAGVRAIRVEAAWGKSLSPERVAEAIRAVKPKVVGLVHAETSTGVLQPVEEIAGAARDAGALTVLDCVTSLGGVPVEVDDWGIDVAYSGAQKCLSGPPGISLLTLSPDAMEAIRNRKSRVQSFYLDLLLHADYWFGGRTYHHTAPVHLVFGLDVALGLAIEEGLEARFLRHRNAHEHLEQGLKNLEIQLLPEAEFRLPMLNALRVPNGRDEAEVRGRLLDAGIEIGAGMGQLAGRIWRVGLMGASATEGNVDWFLAAFEEALKDVNRPE